jgi:hypothetical protein
VARNYKGAERDPVFDTAYCPAHGAALSGSKRSRGDRGRTAKAHVPMRVLLHLAVLVPGMLFASLAQCVDNCFTGFRRSRSKQVIETLLEILTLHNADDAECEPAVLV